MIGCFDLSYASVVPSSLCVFCARATCSRVVSKCANSVCHLLCVQFGNHEASTIDTCAKRLANHLEDAQLNAWLRGENGVLTTEGDELRRSWQSMVDKLGSIRALVFGIGADTTSAAELQALISDARANGVAIVDVVEDTAIRRQLKELSGEDKFTLAVYTLQVTPDAQEQIKAGTRDLGMTVGSCTQDSERQQRLQTTLAQDVFSDIFWDKDDRERPRNMLAVLLQHSAMILAGGLTAIFTDLLALIDELSLRTRPLDDWIRLRASAKGSHPLMRHAVNLPLTLLVVAELDKFILEQRKHKIVLDKVAGVAKDVIGAAFERQLH